MSGLLEWHRRTGFRHWGEGAKVRKAREDRIRALTREPEREWQPLPSLSPHAPMPGFSSQYDAPRRRGETARSRNVDQILAALGYRPRP